MKAKQLQELPEWIDEFIWEQFKLHRKQMRKKMTNYAEYLIVEKLSKFRDEGYDPNELLNIAIEKSWMSIYIPHDMKKIKTRGGFGLDPDQQMEIAMKDLDKGKYVN